MIESKKHTYLGICVVFVPFLVGILFGLIIGVAYGNYTPTLFTSPPWLLNAHNSGGCPTPNSNTNCPYYDSNGYLHTIVTNFKSSTSNYNSNIILGNEDYTGCTTNCYIGLNSTTLIFVNGTLLSQSTNSSVSGNYVDAEDSFFFHFSQTIQGYTGCPFRLINTTWLDIEIFFSGRAYQAPYVGCGLSTSSTYREIESTVSVGSQFGYTGSNGLDLWSLYNRAIGLSIKSIPIGTSVTFTGIEMGVEGQGANISVIWYWYVIESQGNHGGCGGCHGQ